MSDVSIYDLKRNLEDGEKALPTLQRIALQAPNEFSCRTGGGRSGEKGGGRSPANVNALGKFFGPRKELEELLEPVLRVAKPTEQKIEDMTFWEAKEYLFHNTPTDRFQVKSAYSESELPEAGIEELLRGVAGWPGSSNEDGAGFAVFALGGAVSRVPKEATAYVHRGARFLLAMDSSWTGGDPESTEKANADWVEGFAEGMRAYTSGHAYQNFIDRTQPVSANAYYGSNLDRLARIKTVYDPDDLFRFRQSIPLRRSA